MRTCPFCSCVLKSLVDIRDKYGEELQTFLLNKIKEMETQNEISKTEVN